MPTSSNPFFPKHEIEAQKQLIDPDEFAQEWEGKFVALGNSPFDVSHFGERSASREEAAEGAGVLYKIRYWDIANSEKGDYTASCRMDITDKPTFILSDPVRFKGLWGNNYPYIKARMLMEPDVLHVFETEGVGGIAWQMVQMDTEVAHISKMPATRVFTQSSKEERAQLWAMELQNRRMRVVDGVGVDDLIDEIAAFPNGDNDDQVDSISGDLLSFIYFYGGYKKLLSSKKIQPQTVRPAVSYEKMNIIHALHDVM